MASKGAPGPRFRRDGSPPSFQLTEDDAAILWHVWRHRLIDSAIIFKLFPHRSEQVLRDRLKLLFRGRYLGRPGRQIARYEPGGGTKPMVYGLDREGARVLRDRFGAAVGVDHWGQKNREVKKTHIDHTLATTRFMVAHELACRRRGDVRLLPFDELLATLAPERTKRAAIPDRWRVPIAWNGHRGEEGTRPDRIFGLEYAHQPVGKNRSFFYVEIDEGTETIEPGERQQRSAAFFRQSSVLRKFIIYAFSRMHRLHERHFDFASTPRILTVTTTPARAAAMQETYERHLLPQPLAVPPGMFLFTDKDTLAAHDGDVLAMPWRNGVGKEVWIDGR
jgi:hypothetical protein